MKETTARDEESIQQSTQRRGRRFAVRTGGDDENRRAWVFVGKTGDPEGGGNGRGIFFLQRQAGGSTEEGGGNTDSEAEGEEGNGTQTAIAGESAEEADRPWKERGESAQPDGRGAEARSTSSFRSSGSNFN